MSTELNIAQTKEEFFNSTNGKTYKRATTYKEGRGWKGCEWFNNEGIKIKVTERILENGLELGDGSIITETELQKILT